jgi:hypothetical protein
MTELIIGRGKLFFDPFLPGTKTPTGEMYFGNTPELTTNNSADSVEHFSSEGGLKELDASVDLQVTSGVGFKCDHISLENVGLWLSGEYDVQTITSHSPVDTLSGVKKGRYYQLGADATRPQGYRDITLTYVHDGAATITAPNNYDFDPDLGRLYIHPDAVDIDDGDNLTVSYTVAAGTAQVASSGNKSLFGALRFISDNPVGNNRDWYWPYVKLSSDGDFGLKGDDWQAMGFTGKVLKRDAATAREYVDGRASTN